METGARKTERLLLDGGGEDDEAPPAGLDGDPEEAAERWAWAAAQKKATSERKEKSA